MILEEIKSFTIWSLKNCHHHHLVTVAAALASVIIHSAKLDPQSSNTFYVSSSFTQSHKLKAIQVVIEDATVVA